MSGSYTPTHPRYPDVTVQLTGRDGDAFSVIAEVGKALRLAHGREAADDFLEAAMHVSSYDQLLYIVQSTVEVH